MLRNPALALLLAAGAAVLSLAIGIENWSRSSYTVAGTLAVLPGNPYQTRIYSLLRAVLPSTFQFPALVPRLISTGDDVVVRYFARDAGTAVLVIQDTVAALLSETSRRAAADPDYGAFRVLEQPHAIQVDGQPGAEAKLSIQGLRWNEADKQATVAQLAAIVQRLSSDDALLAAARQIGVSADTRSLRASLHFGTYDDSFLRVVMTATDPRLERLVSALFDGLPRQNIDLAGRIPESDLDFIRPHLRRDVYVFNCCMRRP